MMCDPNEPIFLKEADPELERLLEEEERYEAQLRNAAAEREARLNRNLTPMHIEEVRADKLTLGAIIIQKRILGGLETFPVRSLKLIGDDVEVNEEFAGGFTTSQGNLVNIIVEG